MRKSAGIKDGAIRFPIVDAALRRHQLAIGGTEQQRVMRLQAFFREHTPKERLADCTICEGVSDINEPHCPYCGDGAGETAIVAEAKAMVITPVQQLDASVKRVHELKARTADSLWELGQEIRRLYDGNLWQYRVHDGQQTYKQWALFCEKELGLSNTYSYRLMDIASQFTREQVREIGPTKLSMTLKVTNADRVKMLRAAAGGATVSQLRELARDIGIVEGSRRTGLDGRQTGRAPRKRAGRKKEKYQTQELIARRELVPHRDGHITGQKIRVPGPLVCEEMITPQLKQRFVLTNEIDGTLILIVERVKV